MRCRGALGTGTGVGQGRGKADRTNPERLQDLTGRATGPSGGGLGHVPDLTGSPKGSSCGGHPWMYRPTEMLMVGPHIVGATWGQAQS